MRFLVWLARQQLPTVIGGGFFGALWMAAQSLIPAALGEAIEAVVHHDRHALWGWCAVVLALGLVQAGGGVMRHRRAVTNFVTADVRVQQLVARKARDLGPDLPRHVDAGEVASIGTTDVMRIGHLLDVTARGTGAVVSYVLVAAILFSSSVRLGLVVIIGAPVFTLLVLPVMRPLERRQSTERFARSDASSLAADTVVGLRVLRGLGGEDVFSERYAVESQKVRRATVRTAIAQSALDALQVFVPGALLVIVTYVGARMVLTSSLPVGKLVAFYAYAAFLTLPIQVLIEVATRWSAATVAAGRVLTVLRREPDLPRVDQPAPEPGRGPLFDPVTGLVIERGKFLVVAARDAEEGSQLAARLGRYVDDPAGAVRLNGTSLSDLDLGVVRRRILVIDREPQLLAGTLEANVDMPASRNAQARPSITEAIDDASATDIVAGLALGLDTELPERGRTLSGGQRQRIILAAALRADPDFLILDEPTSAVDAHTEAAIASGLRAARAGRTTVVISTSPFFLEHADAVAFIEGTEIAVGVHRDLLHLHPNYRALILREST